MNKSELLNGWVKLGVYMGDTALKNKTPPIISDKI